jgi:Dehydrogenases with different specificities (related to short-chain alcohol dehydrogenases)
MPDREPSSNVPGHPRRRAALVTGGTRGIGLGIARTLAHDGWDLLLSGQRHADDVSPVLRELEGLGVSVEYVAGDIADATSRAAIVDRARARYGTLNALVNNAGRAPRVRADIIDASEDSFEEVLRTNLQGPYFLTQAVARDMLDRMRTEAYFRAAIVFVTSVSAQMISINRGEYCISKAGLAMAASLFAVRLAPHGIPVYDVRPGVIATDMTSAVKETYDRRIADGLVPEARWGQPDDVGRTVGALLRGDLPYATGSVIHVDGGLTLPRL